MKNWIERYDAFAVLVATLLPPPFPFKLFVVTAGVFRFQDGSLLKVALTQAGDCIDFAALEAHCTMTFQITGGTGRFKNASGNVTVTMNLAVVVPGNFHMFTDTAKVTGTISGVGGSEDEQ